MGTAAPPSDEPRGLTGLQVEQFYILWGGAGQVWWWCQVEAPSFKKEGTHNGALWYSRETSSFTSYETALDEPVWCYISFDIATKHCVRLSTRESIGEVEVLSFVSTFAATRTSKCHLDPFAPQLFIEKQQCKQFACSFTFHLKYLHPSFASLNETQRCDPFGPPPQSV